MIYDYFIHHAGKSSGSHDKDDSGHRHMFLTFVNNNIINMYIYYVLHDALSVYRTGCLLILRYTAQKVPLL